MDKLYKARLNESLKRRELRLQIGASKPIRSKRFTKKPTITTHSHANQPGKMKTFIDEKSHLAGDKNKTNASMKNSATGQRISRHADIEQKLDKMNLDGVIDTPRKKRLTVEKHHIDPFNQIDKKQSVRMLFQPRYPPNAEKLHERFRRDFGKRQAEKLKIKM